MRLLVDANIPDELADILRGKGYDVTRPSLRAKDPDIALLANKERRIILTQDRDFANILTFPPKHFSGIIRLKIHPPVITQILPALDALFSRFSQSDLDGKLIIVEKNGLRIR